MSDKVVPSERKKRSYFCKVCLVACLNSDGLLAHYEDEDHKEMEEASSGQRYRTRFYKNLQDYILCPKRTEPLIGLQYIIQLYPDVHCDEAFKCTLCNVLAPLYNIMLHIEGFKHRNYYLNSAYKHLRPFCTKRQSFYERKLAIREHAMKVEQQEATLTVKDLKSCSSRIGVKSDFWSYNIKRQDRLEEYKKEQSAQKRQKQNLFHYLETFVVTSEEEATLFQKLTGELEAAIKVYNTESRLVESYKYDRAQSTEGSEGRSSKHSDQFHSKTRSIWYEEEQKPSSSTCNDEVQSTSDKQSGTEENRSRKRSRSGSKDMLLKVTFSTGSKSEEKKENPQEEQESPTACPATETIVEFSDNSNPSLKAMCSKLYFQSDHFQEIQAKRNMKYSTDVAKWESLFASNRPEISNSTFSCGPNSQSSSNTEVLPSAEKKENPRRASLEALSAFDLFSQKRPETVFTRSFSSSDTFASLQSPGFKFNKDNVFQDKDPQHKTKQVEDKDQELPSSSNVACSEAGTTNVGVMHTEPEQADECKLIPPVTKSHQNSGTETSCDQSSDVNANVDQAPKPSHLDESSDLQTCGSKHLDTNTDSQHASSNVLRNTLPSGKLPASGRQLSPEVLQLFKGKEVTNVVRILKTLSPFYPALQELDLEVCAKMLSETGSMAE